jgi:hypothetical protein
MERPVAGGSVGVARRHRAELVGSGLAEHQVEVAAGELGLSASGIAARAVITSVGGTL